MTAASTAPMLEDASPFLPDSDEFHFEGPEKKLVRARGARLGLRARLARRRRRRAARLSPAH